MFHFTKTSLRTTHHSRSVSVEAPVNHKRFLTATDRRFPTFSKSISTHMASIRQVSRCIYAAIPFNIAFGKILLSKNSIINSIYLANFKLQVFACFSSCRVYSFYTYFSLSFFLLTVFSLRKTHLVKSKHCRNMLWCVQINLLYLVTIGRLFIVNSHFRVLSHSWQHHR